MQLKERVKTYRGGRAGGWESHQGFGSVPALLGPWPLEPCESLRQQTQAPDEESVGEMRVNVCVSVE